MQPAAEPLPVRRIEREIVAALHACPRLVLAAPTGSGKTTQLCQILLDRGLAGPRQILVLQPRRVAVRAAARRVATERHGPLGQEVGYQVRFEDRVGPDTRIRFITEGILLRMLETDPQVAAAGAILFDEFHERSLDSDIGLALARRLQSEARPDLLIIVMSATLDTAPVARFLGDCPVLTTEQRTHPIDIRYLAGSPREPLPDLAASQLRDALVRGEPGDALIFMPGKAEIAQTLEALRHARLPEPVLCLPLHGELSPEEQDRAFAPADRRRVIVATNVAETSVTIEGVRIVIDSGLARIARFDPQRGIQTLPIEPISQASADQRAGRAGRTAPGLCHRLWTEAAHAARPALMTPEIQRADLAEVVLLLHALGVRRVADLPMLDPPEPETVARAETLLIDLGALDEQRLAITQTGRRMLALPMHPRLSRMLVEAAGRACAPAAAMVAAALSGRQVLLPGPSPQVVRRRRERLGETGSDLVLLLRAWLYARDQRFSVERCRELAIHAGAAREMGLTYMQIRQICLDHGISAPDNAPPPREEDLARCILAGFVDQLAVRESQGTLDCALTGGRRAALARESAAREARLIVAAELREVAPSRRPDTPRALLQLATPVAPQWIAELFPDRVTAAVEYRLDPVTRRVEACQTTRYRDLIIASLACAATDPAAVARALAEALAADRRGLKGWTHELDQLMARADLVARLRPEAGVRPMPPARIVTCLARALAGCAGVKDARDRPLLPAFLADLSTEEQAALERLAPPEHVLASGKRIKLQYGEDGTVEATMRVIDLSGVEEHPVIMDGRLPILLHLSDAAGKRIADTSDIAAYRRGNTRAMQL